MRRLYIGFLFTVIISGNLLAQKTADILNYITTYKELAINEMKRTGIPAAITLAQGIHETEAGQSDLVKKSNNHFGIKCKASWIGDRVYHDDDAQGECFRSYTRAEDSYMDHSDFLKNSPRYSFLFNIDPTDYEGWAYGLKQAGYATNIHYSQILIKLIRDYNLQDYTLIALGKMKDNNNVVVAPATENTTVISSPGINVVDSKGEEARSSIYPAGAFTINNTRVVYVKANTAWLSVAEEYDISLSRLWDFNDLDKDNDILSKGQLVYLQRKRKAGATEFHVVKAGESLYDISQAEGIRMENLMQLNQLDNNMQPAIGQKLFLQHKAPARPLLANDQKTLKFQTSNSVAANISGPHAPTRVQPQFTTHTVATKETLYSISKKYGVDMDKIVEWNKLDSMNLRAGQELIIYKTDSPAN